ncbi:flavodoxin family protein [Methanotrichaceae archaeon M04Ac]|uniref:Flavodoxin family protein n=1 Tax=Candidatus Methanocrinis alkalitolerans TaxID=3033395 RepID=A0ABT5XF18_9EURY|nr:flavodoxin family protein [Candidatus Methanocrinis alkalitolerans]MDF0593127.1 flavodoxin family protein [Candidatus Methanocrinis alkalitolerans]
MYVLGVSGSPTRDANTDKLVKAVLDGTGLDNVFVKLSDLNIGPCRACMACVKTNRCVLEDDFQELGPQVMEADALVVGSPTYFGLPSGFTKAFMERLYAYRHVDLLTRNKVAAAVAVGCAAEKDVESWLARVMAFGGMDVVGSMSAKGTPCCFVCGVGETCSYASWNAYSPEIAGMDFGWKENYQGYLEILPENVPYQKGSAKILRPFRSVEDEPEVMERARRLGEAIRTRLDRGEE